MEIQTVRMTPEVKQKYVLVRVLHGTEEVLILWGNPTIKWHQDIVDEITSAGYQISEIVGGGWLLPKTNGSVYVWGKSDRLGRAPIALVKEVLKGEVIQEEPE